MHQNHNNKIPKHLSIPLDLALKQPYQSTEIKETIIFHPDNHKEKTKHNYISDHSSIDRHLFDELFQQSEYFTQTHQYPKKHNNSQTKIKKPKSQTRNKKSTTKNKILK